MAVVAIGLAAARGAPYLSLSELNPWLVVFAIGLFAAIFAAPFAIHARVGGAPEDDVRWERAVLLWGLIAIACFGLGLLSGLPSGFGSDSLAGSAGLVIMVEAGLVLGILSIWLLSA